MKQDISLIKKGTQEEGCSLVLFFPLTLQVS